MLKKARGAAQGSSFFVDCDSRDCNYIRSTGGTREANFFCCDGLELDPWQSQMDHFLVASGVDYVAKIELDESLY